MKSYEQQGVGEAKLFPRLPACARLDGRGFHTLTRGFDKPFDLRMTEAMDRVAKQLLWETQATISYTQSDEITLIWKPRPQSHETTRIFGDRVQKLCSTLTSTVTLLFYQALKTFPNTSCLPDPTFDCRVWSVPNLTEAANVLVWRELDATRNSIQMLAQSLYSHNALHLKNSDELQEMCRQKGHNWNDLPERIKRGRYYRCRWVKRGFTPEEIASLPPLHNAHKNPEEGYVRREIEDMRIPPLPTIADKVTTLFGEDNGSH